MCKSDLHWLKSTFFHTGSRFLVWSSFPFHFCVNNFSLYIQSEDTNVIIVEK